MHFYSKPATLIDNSFEKSLLYTLFGTLTEFFLFSTTINVNVRYFSSSLSQVLSHKLKYKQVNPYKRLCIRKQ